MSPVLSCGLEWVVCVGCARWAWRRCTHAGARDSAAWSPASPADFAPVPRVCRAVLASYEPDLARPRWAPARPGGYLMDPAAVAKRTSHPDTAGRCPPYMIYLDHAAREVVLAVRGLSLVRDADYRLLLDGHPGSSPFDGGYVHRGLLRAAVWLLNREADTICRLLRENGPDYSLVLAGHSLGAGVAALMAVVVVNHLDRFGGIPRSRVRCYAIAPARCMSLDLAIKYADVIHSVVLQDDFLPRTPTPLEHIFGSIFCLPCLLFFVCMRDTFVSEDKKLKDPTRLYAPGRMYHIVERKFCRCGRFPPEVRTAIPVEGRFEHIVLSCNAIFDHGIIWIEREAERALEIMNERAEETTPPTQQRMERQSLDMEHKDALERAMSLKLLHDVAPAEEPSLDVGPSTSDEVTSTSDSTSSGRTIWDDLVEQLLDDDESGDPILKEDSSFSSTMSDPLIER
ncbi:uncharacterized protein LOC103695804 [Phoenix dactylifera]|uniref:Uncharacterized protein LOC103695804 n=1 Tax=Phoenix dactylifera TaxID=42345 RepID=A0A8B7BFB4_PHODC|nr:uncharacterized protein LOC103695804 [Phoenix dactylifera]